MNKKLSDIDKYLLSYRVMKFHRTHTNNQIEFGKGFHYLKRIYQDKSDKIVLQKATQNGITEYMIARAVNEALDGRNVFYILPTDLIRTRFISARFDRTIENSPYYRERLVKLDSVNLKRFGEGIINFVGSNSPGNFTEFVAHSVYVDEYDRCNQENLAMAVERQSSIADKKTVYVSNPTIDNFGINTEYLKSDMKRWFIKCECGNWTNPDFFKHIVRQVDNDFVIQDPDFEWDNEEDVRLICEKCGRPMDRFADGEWIGDKKSSVSGYLISKLFSTKVMLREVLVRFQEGLYNDMVMQRFYNGDLGLSFTSAGAKITRKMLDECSEEYHEKDKSTNPCVVGVDVGATLTTVVCEMFQDNGAMKLRLIKACDLMTFEDIQDLERRYNIKCGVIDSRPESRLSRKVVAVLKNWFMADYLTEATRDFLSLQQKMYKTDRTTSLDSVKEAIMLGNFVISKGHLGNKDFIEQMTAATRIFEEKENGNGRYVWVEGNAPDHFHHAVNYAHMAKKLVLSSF